VVVVSGSLGSVVLVVVGERLGRRVVVVVADWPPPPGRTVGRVVGSPANGPWPAVVVVVLPPDPPGMGIDGSVSGGDVVGVGVDGPPPGSSGGSVVAGPDPDP